MYSKSVKSFFKNKAICITGSVGSVGQALLTELKELSPKQIVLLDNNESGLYEQFIAHREFPVKAKLADINDVSSLERAFSGVDFVIHSAAFKHVPLCEYEPQTAYRNNVIGTQNVIDAAIKSKVRKVLFTSSDKAVNPTNVMGITKLLGERLITSANLDSDFTVFASTRFGNVLGSRGSVFPIFYDKIFAGHDLTLTHKEMTRFMMSKKESARLVLESLMNFSGGEIFVTKMPVFNIEDFCHMMIECYADDAGRKKAEISIEDIGPRPGEKLFEALTTLEEITRTYDTGEFFVVLPNDGPHHDKFDYSRYFSTGKAIAKVYDSSKEAKLSIAEGVKLIKDSVQKGVVN